MPKREEIAVRKSVTALDVATLGAAGESFNVCIRKTKITRNGSYKNRKVYFSKELIITDQAVFNDCRRQMLTLGANLYYFSLLL